MIIPIMKEEINMLEMKVLTQFPGNMTTPSLVIVVANVVDGRVMYTNLYRISVEKLDLDEEYIKLEKLQKNTGAFMDYAYSNKSSEHFGEEISSAIISTINDKIGKDIKYVCIEDMIRSLEWDAFIIDLTSK